MIKKALILLISATVLYLCSISAFAISPDDHPSGSYPYYFVIDCFDANNQRVNKTVYYFTNKPNTTLIVTHWENGDGYSLKWEDNDYHSYDESYIYWENDNKWYQTGGGGFFSMGQTAQEPIKNFYTNISAKFSDGTYIHEPKTIRIESPIGTRELNWSGSSQVPILETYQNISIKTTGGIQSIHVKLRNFNVYIDDNLLNRWGITSPYDIPEICIGEPINKVYEVDENGYVNINADDIPYTKAAYYQLDVWEDGNEAIIDSIRFGQEVKNDLQKSAEIIGIEDNQTYDHLPNFSINYKNYSKGMNLIINGKKVDYFRRESLFKAYNNVSEKKWFVVGKNTIKLQNAFDDTDIISKTFTVTREAIKDDTLPSETEFLNYRKPKPKKPDGWNPIDWIIYIADLIDYYITEFLFILTETITSTTGIVNSVTSLFASLFGYMPQAWITIVTISLALGLIMTLTRR